MKGIGADEIKVIQEIAGSMLEEYREQYREEPPIRADIFKLLGEKARLVFYPLDNEPDLDGFHVHRFVGTSLTSFVYINTAKPYEKNIFCAAHELGHVCEIEKTIADRCPECELSSEMIDAIMNRFAAELLMPEVLFKSRLDTVMGRILSDADDGTVEDVLLMIVALMNYFYVPYKAVVIRLKEIDFITEDGKTVLERIEQEYPEILKLVSFRDKDVWIGQKTRRKEIDGLAQRLVFAEQNALFSKEKIRELREAFDILPEEMESQLSQSGKTLFQQGHRTEEQ